MNHVVYEVPLLLQLAIPFFKFKGLITMCNSLKNLLIDNILSRKSSSWIQGSFLFLNFNNFLGKISYLSLIVWDLLVEGVLLVEMFLLLGLKTIELPLTNFTEVPLSSHLIEFHFNLEVRVSTKTEVFDKLSEEGFKSNQVLGHMSNKLVLRKLVKKLEDVDPQSLFLCGDDQNFTLKQIYFQLLEFENDGGIHFWNRHGSWARGLNISRCLAKLLQLLKVFVGLCCSIDRISVGVRVVLELLSCTRGELFSEARGFDFPSPVRLLAAVERVSPPIMVRLPSPSAVEGPWIWCMSRSWVFSFDVPWNSSVLQ